MAMTYFNKTHQGKRLSVEPTIHETASLHKSYVGEWTAIGAGSRLNEVEFGDYSYCVDQVQINYAEIGKFCSIASHVCINPGNHPMWRVTQHHSTYRRVSYGFAEADDAEFFDWRRSHKVMIGHDVWIGHGVTVMPGVTIGTGAVVGSGAVVTKDVAPYTIVAGVPAKRIRERFDPETARCLLDVAWWDWSREELEARFEQLNDVEAFLARYGKG
ncbi:DapH/DapD/GlmU-related protein [Paenibacillus koleovorans]|uniref:DapH/DapD/GlmU-related protein n=1 Tax=Paenibacillus koleovorans TaxID=121608 RepID=UPI0027D8ED96|nr:DapH/DapD/GlmU-related protein [Paenibacillus koleovorans]